MINPEFLTTSIESAFRRIQDESMAEVPILNHALEVATVGFRDWQGHPLGVLITPWFMNLMLLPAEGGEWDDQAIGAQVKHTMPSGECEFRVNEIDGVGRCLMRALHSPMFQFNDQSSAVAVAEAALETLMVEGDAEALQDEEARIQRFLNGGEMADEAPVESCDELKAQAVTAISRRDLLRGAFANKS